jgi:hypothetical protein
MSQLKYWLVRHKPHAILAYDAQKREHSIAVQEKKNKWALVVKSLEAIRAVRIVAFDANNAVIDGCEIDTSGEIDQPLGEELDPNAPAALPMKMREVDFASVLATGMQTAANIAVQAADAAMLRHEEAYAGRREDNREAMNQFATVVRLVTDRLVQLEKAWNVLLMSRTPKEDDADGAVDKQVLDVIDRALGGGRSNGDAKPNGTTPKKPEPLT